MKRTLAWIAGTLAAFILLPSFFYLCLLVWGDWHDDWSGYTASQMVGDGYCNIAVLPIFGTIHTYGAEYSSDGGQYASTNMNDARRFLDMAEYEPGIYGVLALVDSPGGTAAAAELIAADLKKSVMPNAAFIADVGASAGYLIASAADTVIASAFADVGSIGVTMSYLNYSEQNRAEGIEYISLSSGEFKDYASPEKPLTNAERALLERDLAVWHEELVNQVAINRNLPVETVAELADGSSLPAKLALEAGLIDAVGDLDTARAWFAKELEMPIDEIILCPVWE